MQRKVLDYSLIKIAIENITVPIHKALCCLLYGTAGRVNEVLKLEKKDIRVEGNYLLITLKTEKNWQHPERIVPIPIDKENWLVQPILDYLAISPEKLFSFSDRHCRTITHKHLSCHPHHLRHCRLTHLVSIYKADAHRLQLLAGWRSPKPAETYIHLNWQDTKRIFE